VASTARGRLGRDAERGDTFTQPGGTEWILARTDKLISERRIRRMLQGTESQRAATKAGAGTSTPARLTGP
jgi:hypothetical protein